MRREHYPNYAYFTGLADVIGESDNSTELLTTQEAEIVTDEPIEPIEPANEVEKKIDVDVDLVDEGRALESLGINLVPFSSIGVIFLNILIILHH